MSKLKLTQDEIEHLQYLDFAANNLDLEGSRARHLDDEIDESPICPTCKREIHD